MVRQPHVSQPHESEPSDSPPPSSSTSATTGHARARQWPVAPGPPPGQNGVMRSLIPKSMRRQIRVPPVLWYCIWFAIVFWLGGSLPIWDVWFQDGGHLTFEWGTLWSLIGHLPEAAIDDAED